MLVKQKGTFIKGLVMAIAFLVVLVAMFSPIFGGQNAMVAADKLFNSIAKGSTNYLPGLVKKNAEYANNTFDASLKLKNQDMAKKSAKILVAAGAKSEGETAEIKVNGNLGAVISAALKDSEAMFNNRDAELSARYGMPGQEALYVWWNVLKEIDKDLTRQKRFKEAAFVADIVKKGVEVSYNFANITPESAKSRMGILSFSLVFYVIYTLWWGLAVMYIFEGIGLQMTAGSKKEV
jgi:hypothetical protein